MLKEHAGSIDFKVKGFVLILVLMEHAPRDLLPLALISLWASLNPYFNGTCSKSQGIRERGVRKRFVLILILMEHAQREGLDMVEDQRFVCVLILILMEHAQRGCSNVFF